MRLYGGPIPANVSLTDDWVAQVACLADSKGLTHFQAASLMSSVFLMRVQSETLKLELGASAGRCQLHENRHSAVWSEDVAVRGTVFFVNLSRQKNGPRGSLLRRTGTCHLGDARCCVGHVVQRVLSLVAVGAKLFPFNGTEFRRVLCRLLTLLGHNEASPSH